MHLSNRTISIGVIGIGLIGSALIDQIQSQLEVLANKYNLKLTVRGLMNSKKMLLSDQSLSLVNWRKTFDRESVPSDLNYFIQTITQCDASQSLIIDCTASQDIASHYAEFLKAGAHIITPNKLANALSHEDYISTRKTVYETGKKFLYETSVCAGLPVINTIQDLIRTGDEVKSITGIFSGSLNYILELYNNGLPFSQAVAKAKESGYCEPDPREDLSGSDVARKIICLVRECGVTIEYDNIKIQNLVPPPLQNVTVEEFLDKISQYEEWFDEHIKNVRSNNKIVKYVAEYDKDLFDCENTLKIGLKSIDDESVLAHCHYMNNAVVIYSMRYNIMPLVVQGPGAGPDVTAAGIFAEILRLFWNIG